MPQPYVRMCRARAHLARLGLAAGAVAALAWPPAVQGQASPVDPELPAYQPVSGISGSLSSAGSDTLVNLMTRWSQAYAGLYPGVRSQVEGKGSSTAPAALIEGTAQLGSMSREMRDSEIRAFEARFGYPPTAIRVAIDALAVYVHRDNPLDQLSLDQVDAVFSETRRCGLAETIERWEQLGVTGDLAPRPIRLYGRNSASGTYGYFKQRALCQGDFRDTTKEQPGSASVVQAVGEDPQGIGYSGIGYRTSGVKALALASRGGQPHAPPLSPEDLGSGRYPLTRFLIVYVNRPPGRALDRLTEQFVRFVLSRQGQEVVLRDGYLPLPARIAAQERAKLD